MESAIQSWIKIMQPPDIDVTILMPCLNEARTLPRCIGMAQEAMESLWERGLSGEIVICDNGSSDGSAELAEQLGCRVVHAPQRGYGSALIYGILQTRGRYIVMGDSDASYDFRESVAMVEKLREGNDLCKGNRFKARIRPGAMPWKNRYLGNPALTRILNLFYRSGVHDAHCGLRAFTRQAFRTMRLHSPGMEFASEMVVKAALLGLKCAEVPVTLHPDERGRPPHLRPWRDGWRHLKFLLLLSPLWLFFIPAAVLMLFSVVIFAGLLSTPPEQIFRFGPFWMGDHWMILAGGLFNLGFSDMVLGVVASAYAIVRGYRRPHTRLHRMVRALTVERCLGFGALLVVCGLVVLGSVVVVWYRTDGPLERIREMVISTVMMLSGAQMVFGSFLLALICAETVTWSTTIQSDVIAGDPAEQTSWEAGTIEEDTGCRK
jgi:glycosyltransferase involved in cell wall biosynthesis